MKKNCIACDKLYNRPRNYSQKQWSSRKVCSLSCANKLPRSTKNKPKSSVKKRCIFCKKEFIVQYSLSKIKKYCSIKCYRNNIKGKSSGYSSWNKGLPPEEHPRWLGKDVGYQGIHTWVRRKFGRVDHCAFCGSKGSKKRGCDWANIDHLYTRNRKDWIRLCRKCHYRYDRKMIK